MKRWLLENGAWIGSAAAIFGVLFAAVQYRQAAAQHAETRVVEAWSDYLSAAAEQTDLSSGAGNPDDPKYQWFVSRMLWAAEQVLSSDGAGDNIRWVMTVDDQLLYHVQYICDRDRIEWSHYSDQLVRRIMYACKKSKGLSSTSRRSRYA